MVWPGFSQVFCQTLGMIWLGVLLGFGHDLARHFAWFWPGFSQEFCWTLARCFAGFWFGQPLAGIGSGVLSDFGHDFTGCFGQVLAVFCQGLARYSARFWPGLMARLLAGCFACWVCGQVFCRVLTMI